MSLSVGLGDLQLVRKGINLSRKRKWLILLALFGASSYGAYKVYHSPTVTRTRESVARILGALASAVEMVSDSAETVAIVSKDVNAYLRSDSDEVPNSLNQISKLSRSNEFSRSLSKFFEAVTGGMMRGYHQSQTGRTKNESDGGGSSSSLSDRVIDRVLSDAGTGFVSVVVGSFARNLVLGFFSDDDNEGRSVVSNSVTESGLDGSNTTGWVDAVCDDKSKELIANCVQVLVSTAVAAYLDQTMDVNMYDELFAGLTDPKHETKVRDFLVSVCNGAVETFVKTSHQVLTSEKMNDDVGSSSSNSSAYCLKTNVAAAAPREHSQSHSNVDMEMETGGAKKWDFDKKNKRHWLEIVSSTLADSNNRRFVISMTGRVTFETLRSLVDFFLWKMSDGLRTATDIVNARGLEVVRYFSARSSVIITICLALYLHFLFGTNPLPSTC